MPRSECETFFSGYMPRSGTAGCSLFLEVSLPVLCHTAPAQTASPHPWAVALAVLMELTSTLSWAAGEQPWGNAVIAFFPAQGSPVVLCVLNKGGASLLAFYNLVPACVSLVSYFKSRDMWEDRCFVKSPSKKDVLLLTKV